MLVETLTGARPFQGGTVERVLAQVLQGDYHLPGDSPEARVLDGTVQRCLAAAGHKRLAARNRRA